MRYRVEAKESDRTGQEITVVREDDLEYIEAGDFSVYDCSLTFCVSEKSFNSVNIGDIVGFELVKL